MNRWMDTTAFMCSTRLAIASSCSNRFPRERSFDSKQNLRTSTFMPFVAPRLIESARVCVRPISESDLPSLLAINGNEEVVRFLGHAPWQAMTAVSYTHLRAHETPEHLVCRLL